MFRPSQINELRTPAEILIPTTEDYLGVITKTFPESGEQIFVNFKSKGGTETTVNGVYSVLDTAEIVTWYDPRITSDCRIKIGSDLYEVKVGFNLSENVTSQFLIYGAKASITGVPYRPPDMKLWNAIFGSAVTKRIEEIQRNVFEEILK